MSDIGTKSQELAKQLWAIANDLRGNMDSSKFKNYILGTIFYRYLSERTEKYMDEILKNDGVTYREALANDELSEAVKELSLDHLGYIIEPDDLFNSLVEKIKSGTFSIEDYEKAISSLVGSTIGQESEAAFDKLFDDMNLQDKDLGREVSQRTKLISKVITKVYDIDFRLNDAEFDVLGTAYMILIGLFASDAGKKGGEFFTPTKMSELVARLATLGLNSIKSACDPCAGSGSLLLEVRRHCKDKQVNHYYGQEKNGTTYNLMRQNMLMHGVPYKEFTVFNDDTIEHDNFGETKFQVQVANPPYSSKYSADKKFENDPRYSSCGALAPKSYADLMFLEHIAYHLDDDGRAAVLLPHGVLFRGNNEGKIRRYLIENRNVIDAIIGLPANCFHGTSIPVCCIVLRKNRNGNSGNVWFCDASKYYTAGKNMNELSDKDIDRIVNAYAERAEIEKFSRAAPLEEIAGNDYNCNIPRYVDTFEEEEPVDIAAVRAELDEITAKKRAALEKVNAMMKELGL
ncbi:MAG: type I restriction-modification system subunit M [Lachnospiraceae bacterium]|nr:type I restriction-modification system subunit M [Ruminococcus sp.]MCM1276498.1 type I restriction-modification system subunit M [Lachnospiraceae bacterium]